MSTPGKRGGGAIVSFLSLAASPSSTFLEAINAGEEATHRQARLSHEDEELPNICSCDLYQMGEDVLSCSVLENKSSRFLVKVILFKHLTSD